MSSHRRHDVDDLLDRVDAYLDAAPRPVCDTVDTGSFTVFLGRGTPWPFYARPRREHRAPGPEDVAAARAVQREHGVEETFEWVHERAPALAETLEENGFEVILHPLLVLLEPLPVEPPAGVRLHLVDAEDGARIHAGQIVADLGFADAGTAVGAAGTAQRDEALRRDWSDGDAFTQDRIRSGRTVQIVAEDDDGVLGVGYHQPIAGASEIVGVATLPAARRRGVAAALTAALVQHAMDSGVDLVLLSSSSDDVARVYERVGFRRIGHAGGAELPAAKG